MEDWNAEEEVEGEEKEEKRETREGGNALILSISSFVHILGCRNSGNRGWSPVEILQI